MLNPHTRLPWTSELMTALSVDEEVFVIGNKKIASAEVPWVRRDPVHDKEAAKQDADYIVEACNKYPLLVEFLTKIEAHTSDKNVADLIGTFMRENKLW